MSEISSGHIELLVAYLDGDVQKVASLGRALQSEGDSAGYGKLLAATFIIATRRHFDLTWNQRAAVSYVADVRTRSNGHPDLDPVAGEVLIYRALGGDSDKKFADGQQAKAMLNLLEAMVVDAGLDSNGIEALVVEAQSAAPSIFPTPAP